MEEQEDENTVGYKYGWIQMAKLWDSVRDPLWGSVRQLEGMFGFSSRGWIPGVIGLSGDTEVELVVDAARRMGHALKETGRSAEFASIVAASGALPSLARCLWLIQSSMVAGALEVLRMTCWPLHRELPSQEPRGALTQPNTPPDYGGCISPGSRAVVEVLLKPQHFVVRPSGGPFAASSSSRGTGASTSQPRADEIESNRVFDSVLERPLDRLIRLATDPGVVMRSVDYLDQHFTAQQVQSDALRTIATLLATTDAGTSLSLLADPKLVHVIMSLHEHPLAHPHPHPHTSFNGTPSSYTSAEMPYSATPLRYSIMGVIAGLIAAVPRWEQAVEEGHGVFGSGGESVARCDSAGDTKKRDKKKGGGGGGGGGTASAVQSEQYTPAKSLSVAAGLRAAADVLSYMECLANELQHPQEQLFVRSMDNYLYDLLEAVQPGENVLRVVGTRELKVGYTTRIMNMLEKLGGGAAAAAAAVAAVSATAAGGGGTSPVLPARTGHRAVAEDGACGIDVGTDRCGSDVNAAAAVPAATTSTAAASGSGTFAVSAAKQCANCGVREGDPGVGKLRKCGGCLVARYCSSGCQAAAWPQHKRECKGMAGGSRGGARDSAVRAIRQISS
ncbi:hypothetical protein Vretifemale_13180 [Volvox reticuliferus]|nr:hypothetical protein Vretifemale_13180 [Volvox reticuliferus]